MSGKWEEMGSVNGATTTMLEEAVLTSLEVIQDDLTGTAIARIIDPLVVMAEIEVGIAIGIEVVAATTADNGTAHPTTVDQPAGR